MDPLTLRFGDAALEAGWQRAHADRAVDWLWWFYAIGAVVATVGGLVALSPLVAGSARLGMLRGTLLLLVASCVVLLAATRTAWFKRFHQPIVATMMAVSPPLVVAPALLSETPGAEPLTAIALHIVGVHTIVMLRFVPALVTSVVVWLVYVFFIGPVEFGLSTPVVAEHGLTLAFAVFIGAFAAYRIERSSRQAYADRERSERLLLNVLPPSIAERLKAGEEPIADGHAEVTVLFADVVGFTAYAAKTSPEDVVAQLNRMFTRFDELAAKHGLEKIKTIGDAYMVAAGLPQPRDDHAQAAARMAIDMLYVMHELGGSVRIGLHSGPVVAGVIGKRKFAYDLWGDAVNTAARMESHGLPGEVQVSDATRRHLGQEWTLEPRGEVEIKGKGMMSTWLLRSGPKG